MSTVVIIDYDSGNLRSVQKALEFVGAKTKITQSADDISKADKLVLPGVGAFAVAMEKLADLGLIESIKDFIKSDKPFLGICLGLQLLFSSSQEAKGLKGLDIFKGSVDKFKGVKVPHIGWNQLNKNSKDNCQLFKGINDGANMYFCHSYFVNPDDKDIIASKTEYGTGFVSAVSRGNTFGVQFHPEKSQRLGLKILENFLKV
ncbi:MAG: imidazole glycerol phosphate synthase subunit HisH [Candidatus Omnitrophica bacterium]|nr:imidazole glycerol phosphate synthase subunit HisH [Candidatus Omnitrophota bacterium]HOX54875.1 imidazole glycerol phosphate synthase subunit HisH [Candidatus Omnitrophota bacterium]